MTHNEDAFYLRYDGPWSSRRNATHCLVEVINDDGKIVDFDILSRIPCTRYRVYTGYFGPSNRMEEILIEQLSDKWKNNPKLKGFVHDGDLKSAKFWMTPSQETSPLVELHDPGHAKKSIEKIFDDFNKNKHLYSLKKQIIGYFAYLCKASRITLDEKYDRWHHLEDKLREKPPRRSFLNPNSKKGKSKEAVDECRKVLNEFIEKTIDIMTSCAVADTQSNESFHSLKAKIAPKNIAWKTSWRLRMCLAILSWNLGDQLTEFLDFHFDLQLSPQNSKLLSSIEKSLKKKRFVSKSIIARYNRNKQRQEKRESNKDDPEGHKYSCDAEKTKTKSIKKTKEGNQESSETTKFKFPSTPSAGIANAGSTCIFASAIQILSNTEIPYKLSSKINIKSSPFETILNSIFTSLKSDKDVTVDNVRSFFEQLPTYNVDQPSDANEFMFYIINTLRLHIYLTTCLIRLKKYGNKIRKRNSYIKV